MLLLAVSAMVVLLFAPVATAMQYRADDSPATMTATATATSTATATATASGAAGGGGGKKCGQLPQTGGPESMALLAGTILVGSGVVALAYVRRRDAS